jgi:hypothetical protein
MKEPIEFLISNRKRIIEEYNQNHGQTKNTWNCLEKTLPELLQVMSFNTFKQYVRILAAVVQEINKPANGKRRVIQNLYNSPVKDNGQKTPSQNELDKVIQMNQAESSVRQKLDRNPKRIFGWNVQRAKDGYYRCYRKINNRVHSIYIGKTLDRHKAELRIQQKELELGIDSGYAR